VAFGRLSARLWGDELINQIKARLPASVFVFINCVFECVKPCLKLQIRARSEHVGKQTTPPIKTLPESIPAAVRVFFVDFIRNNEILGRGTVHFDPKSRPTSLITNKSGDARRLSPDFIRFG
jgi:hypothetical protein